MIIHLLRHTQPDIKAGICYGQSDIGLVKSFTRELALIHNKVSLLPIDSIFSSPLQRCATLAQCLITDDLQVQIDKRLMELDFGKWELETWDAISESTEGKHWFSDYVNECCPSGESYLDLLNRVKEFMTYLKSAPNIKQPLVVTHAGVIRAIYSIIKQCTIEEAFNVEIKYGQLMTLKL